MCGISFSILKNITKGDNLNRLIILTLLLLVPISSFTEVVINELLYDAVGVDTGKEWIELYNNSDEDISLHNWELQAGGKTFSTIFIFPNITIRAKSFFLISESNNLPLTNLVTALGFENGGSATDGVRILNPANQYTDTILYDFPNSNNLAGDAPTQTPCPSVAPGHSLARYRDGEDTNSASDWFDCTTPTPGRSNIVERRVTLTNCKTTNHNSYIELSTVILNLSTSLVDNHELAIKTLFNNELKSIDNLSAISPLDSLKHCVTVENELNEEGEIIVELINNSNIELVDNLWKMWISQQIVVVKLSEVMYNPRATQAEWIELKLLNDVESAELSITDFAGNSCTANISGEAGDYLVIAENRENLLLNFVACDENKVFQATGWAILNNSGDSIIVEHGAVVLDSLQYSSNSAPKGYSLEYNERDDSWSRSVAEIGGTPTQPNSCLDNPHQQITGIEVINAVISQKRDKQLKLIFSLDKSVSSLILKLYDLRGKEIDNLKADYSQQYDGEFVWDGAIKGKYLVSGLYPAVLTLRGSNGKVIREKKILITINR